MDERGKGKSGDAEREERGGRRIIGERKEEEGKE